MLYDNKKDFFKAALFCVWLILLAYSMKIFFISCIVVFVMFLISVIKTLDELQQKILENNTHK